MSYMFYDCISLLSIDMSKWNINIINYFDYMFLGCSSLNNISDFSKWDKTNINSMNSLFYECTKLKHIPNIKKQN